MKQIWEPSPKRDPRTKPTVEVQGRRRNLQKAQYFAVAARGCLPPHTISRKRNDLARNNICTLYLIIRPYCLQKILKLVAACRRYSKPKQCRFRDTVYSITENTISGVHVYDSPSSAETWVTRGGITNHHLTTNSLSNNCAKNYQNRLMCVEVTVCNMSVVFWDTV